MAKFLFKKLQKNAMQMQELAYQRLFMLFVPEVNPPKTAGNSEKT
jgi:hypothetical protein